MSGVATPAGPAFIIGAVIGCTLCCPSHDRRDAGSWMVVLVICSVDLVCTSIGVALKFGLRTITEDCPAGIVAPAPAEFAGAAACSYPACWIGYDPFPAVLVMIGCAGGNCRR